MFWADTKAFTHSVVCCCCCCYRCCCESNGFSFIGFENGLISFSRFVYLVESMHIQFTAVLPYWLCRFWWFLVIEQYLLHLVNVTLSIKTVYYWVLWPFSHTACEKSANKTTKPKRNSSVVHICFGFFFLLKLFRFYSHSTKLLSRVTTGKSKAAGEKDWSNEYYARLTTVNTR